MKFNGGIFVIRKRIARMFNGEGDFCSSPAAGDSRSKHGFEGDMAVV